MPMLSDGGLFVPTSREYKLGDDIYLLLEHGNPKEARGSDEF